MNREQVCQILAEKKGVLRSYPFGDDVAVFKVMGKMFALVGESEGPVSLNLKCDPLDAKVLRGMYAAITPGYHMNKRHWNTVILDGSVSDTLLMTMIDDSYDLVVAKLTRADQEKLKKS